MVLDPRILDHLHGQKNLAEEATQNQVKGGYKPDKWGMTVLGEITKYKIVLQSLVDGEESLCLPTSLSYEAFNKLLNNPPKGTSRYFSTACALAAGTIHEDSPGSNKKQPHFHQRTQVKPFPTLGHRKTIGAFDLKKLHSDLISVPVAIAETKANISEGPGGTIQLFVPLWVVPLIHMNAIKIISHQKDNASITDVKQTLNPHTKKMEWNFKRKNPDSNNNEIILLGAPHRPGR